VTFWVNENQGGSLEDFMFRRYNPTQGRSISPDPAGLSAANPSNPQSWNRYAYVVNSPLANVDPSGLACYGLEIKLTGGCGAFLGNGIQWGGSWNEFYVLNAAFTPTAWKLDGYALLGITNDGNILTGAAATDAYLAGDTFYTNEISSFSPIYGNIGLLDVFMNPPQQVQQPQQPPCSTNCHVPNYTRPLSCDRDACTPAQKAQWCANAKSMAALGLKVTGQNGLGPLITGTLGVMAYYLESLGGPLTVVGGVQGSAANMSNYVDGICKGD
jgi:RHS repeat-associated protein